MQVFCLPICPICRKYNTLIKQEVPNNSFQCQTSIIEGYLSDLFPINTSTLNVSMIIVTMAALLLDAIGMNRGLWIGHTKYGIYQAQYRHGGTRPDMKMTRTCQHCDLRKTDMTRGGRVCISIYENGHIYNQTKLDLCRSQLRSAWFLFQNFAIIDDRSNRSQEQYTWQSSKKHHGTKNRD